MTLEKAIETLDRHYILNLHVPLAELNEAGKLGIEAMKFRIRWEQQEGEDDFPLLPGETKE